MSVTLKWTLKIEGKGFTTMTQVTLHIAQNDHDGERSGTSINWSAINETNFVDAFANMAIMQARIDALTLGTVAERTVTFRTRVSNAAATSPNAQRETKWLVVYEDITQEITSGVPNLGYGKLFTLEIPCADLSLLRTNSDEIDYSNAAYTAFKTAFETHARSPYGGSVRIRVVRHVGRNV